MSQVGLGSVHSLFLDLSGSVWVAGSGRSGRIGTKNCEDVYRGAEKLPLQFKVVSLCASEQHSLFLDDTGSAWSCGDGTNENIGIKNVSQDPTPTKILSLPPVQAICTSLHRNSFFLDVYGHVWGCGINLAGQLGLGDTLDRTTPKRIMLPISIQSISVGHYHSLFLDVDGFVWSCGANSYAQLAHPDTNKRLVPEKIEQLHSIREIAAGGYFSLFLDAHGVVWSCGCSSSGQLAIEFDENKILTWDCWNPLQQSNCLPPIVKMSAGFSYSLFLDVDGFVWCTGSNDYGQLGLGDLLKRLQPEKNGNLPKIQEIFAGLHHSAFIDNDGSLWCCGNNDFGQVGLYKEKPVQDTNDNSAKRADPEEDDEPHYYQRTPLGDVPTEEKFSVPVKIAHLPKFQEKVVVDIKSARNM